MKTKVTTKEEQIKANKKKITTKDITYISLFSVIIAICSWISIPTLVPFTLQTFAVFTALALLGGKRGTICIAIYILLGSVGLPVFANFKGGLGALLGPTGGYIIGFLALGLVYWLMTELISDRLPVKIVAMVLGNILCYALGTLWFVPVYSKMVEPIGIISALLMCVTPYIIVDLIKLALALIISNKLKKHM